MNITRYKTLYLQAFCALLCFFLTPNSVSAQSTYTAPYTAACNVDSVNLYNGIIIDTTGYTITFFGDNAFTNTILSTVNVTGTYYVKFQNIDTTVYDSIHATLRSSPAFLTNEIISSCGASSVSLYSGITSDTAGLTVYFFSNRAHTDTISATVSSTAWYYATAYNSAGCYTSDSINVVISTIPVITTNSITSACGATYVHLTSAIISSTSGLDVTFYSNSALTTVISDSVITAGRYYVQVINAQGCYDSAHIQVTFRAVPILSLQIIHYCDSSSANLRRAITSDTSGLSVSFYNSPLFITPISPIVTSTGFYYARATATNGCTTDDAVYVSLSFTPSVSTGSYDTLCSTGSSQLLTGTPSGGTFSGTGVSSGYFNPSAGTQSIYYQFTNSGGCTGYDTTTIVVKTPPDRPYSGSVSGPTKVCNYIGNLSYAKYYIAPISGATTYQWSAPSGAEIVSGQYTDTIYVRYDSAFTLGYIGVQAGNECGYGDVRLYGITRIPPLPPVFKSPVSNVCDHVNQTPVTYNISAVTYAEGYIWRIKNGAYFRNSGDTIFYGAIEDTTADVVFTSSYISGTAISVQSIASCGNSALRKFTIYSKIPARPGVISTSSADICKAIDSVRYSITRVAGANQYKWVRPAGCVFLSPNGTLSGALSDTLLTADTAIAIAFDHSFVTGNLKVAASSNCGVSAYTTYVAKKLLPATPGVIVQSKTIVDALCNATNAKFIVPAIAIADGFKWTVPTGITINSGQNTDTLTVTFASTFITGTISVKSYRICGDSVFSAIRSLTVKKVLPNAPSLVSGSLNVCARLLDGTSETYTVSAPATGPVPDAYTWKITGAGAMITDTGGVTLITPVTMITVSSSNLNVSLKFSPATFTSVTLGVYSVVGCSTYGSSTAAKSIKISKLALPTVLDGPTLPCINQDVTYSVISDTTGVTSYAWTKPLNAVMVTPSSVAAAIHSSSIIVRFTTTARSLVAVKTTTACGTSAVFTIRDTPVVCTPRPMSPHAEETVKAMSSDGSFKVFPNPNNGNFHIQLEGIDGREPVQIQLISLSGRVVAEWNTITNLGNAELDVRRNLIPGLYLLRYMHEGKLGAVKMVVQ